MTSIRTTNNKPASSSSSSRSPPVAAETSTARRRTPTPSAAAVLPLMATVIKKETATTTTTANEEIKEFAETAMNELLGWYGYGTPENASKRIAVGLPVNGNAVEFKRDFDRMNSRPGNAPEYHQHSQRESQSQSPHSVSNSPLRISPIVTPPTDSNNTVRPSSSCDWCHRKINREAETYGTTEGVRFCSEPCFSQSRRATFKRAKTCDWCRHVRHAVSYVDFQDGASQLQFCSDKCLNQYKMEIFIKETQAHLEMNPQLMEKGEGSGMNLITPDLWLKNCRSRSASPELSKSRSTSPEGTVNEPSALKNHLEVGGPSSTVIRPTITVAPVSKLLPPPPASQPNAVELISVRPSMKSMRKQRRTLRNGPPVREHQLSYSHRVVDDNSSTHPRPSIISPGSASHSMPVHSEPPKASPNQGEPIVLNSFDRRFLSPPPNLYPIRQQNMAPPPPLFRPSPIDHQQQRHPLPLPLPTLRHGGYPPSHRPHPEAQHYPAQYMMGSHVPPVTILVPCPIILPIPVPIPIPISMPEFLAKLLSASSATPTSHQPAESINPRNAQANDENNNSSSTGTAAADDRNHPFDCSSNPSNATDKNFNRDSARDQNGMDSESEVSDNGSSSPKSCEIVPKIKITRLQSKRILTTKELDSSRPLRKRKRIVVASYT